MSGTRTNPARTKRIQREIEKLNKTPQTGISFEVSGKNFGHIYALIDGPQDSPYEGYRFKLEIFLPAEYPMKPPKIRFMTKIYHPNVDAVGRICVDILKDQWSPALTVAKVLVSLQALLSAPNPDDPLEPTIGRLWKSNLKKAHANARKAARKHGIEIPAAPAAGGGGGGGGGGGACAGPAKRSSPDMIGGERKRRGDGRSAGAGAPAPSSAAAAAAAAAPRGVGGAARVSPAAAVVGAGAGGGGGAATAEPITILGDDDDEGGVIDLS